MKFSNATVLYGCELGPYCFYLVVVVVVIVIVVKPQPTLYVWGPLPNQGPIRNQSGTNQGPMFVPTETQHKEQVEDYKL